jgi:hypothetical protein
MSSLISIYQWSGPESALLITYNYNQIGHQQYLFDNALCREESYANNSGTQPGLYVTAIATTIIGIHRGGLGKYGGCFKTPFIIAKTGLRKNHGPLPKYSHEPRR